jgi:hypothetical protein
MYAMKIMEMVPSPPPPLEFMENPCVTSRASSRGETGGRVPVNAYGSCFDPGLLSLGVDVTTGGGSACFLLDSQEKPRDRPCPWEDQRCFAWLAVDPHLPVRGASPPPYVSTSSGKSLPTGNKGGILFYFILLASHKLDHP